MREVSLHENINNICETAPGRFRIILDFATVGIVNHLLRDDYKYVWVHNHAAVYCSDWKEFELPILPSIKNQWILARNVQYDFIIETEEFKKLLPDWKGGIKMVQMNSIPPHYINLEEVKGNTRYELLREKCDFLFEVNIPSATDYGFIISNDREYLQSLLDNPEIDWKDLP